MSCKVKYNKSNKYLGKLRCFIYVKLFKNELFISKIFCVFYKNVLGLIEKKNNKGNYLVIGVLF